MDAQHYSKRLDWLMNSEGDVAVKLVSVTDWAEEVEHEMHRCPSDTLSRQHRHFKACFHALQGIFNAELDNERPRRRVVTKKHS